MQTLPAAGAHRAALTLTGIHPVSRGYSSELKTWRDAPTLPYPTSNNHVSFASGRCGPGGRATAEKGLLLPRVGPPPNCPASQVAMVMPSNVASAIRPQRKQASVATHRNPPNASRCLVKRVACRLQSVPGWIDYGGRWRCQVMVLVGSTNMNIYMYIYVYIRAFFESNQQHSQVM